MIAKCYACKGAGELTADVDTFDHVNGHDTRSETYRCYTCNGTSELTTDIYGILSDTDANFWRVIKMDEVIDEATAEGWTTVDCGAPVEWVGLLPEGPSKFEFEARTFDVEAAQ